jgi:hypothetical protein
MTRASVRRTSGFVQIAISRVIGWREVLIRLSSSFTKAACAIDALGNMGSKYLMGYYSSRAVRLEKFGA